jgi:hypothetical protein
MCFNDDKINQVILDGYKRMSISRVSICSIVRDCQKNLKHNIRKIEAVRKCFMDSEVVIFENDSRDLTKEIIEDWSQRSQNIIFRSEKFQNRTIPERTSGANPYFSKQRIGKMSFYRNKYLEIINSNSFKRDFVIIIDLDISDFKIDGIAHSFGADQEWSCITSNGTSLSRTFRTQYHDTYALVEKGSVLLPMNEKMIRENRKKFSFLRKGMPLFSVDSAFGGLAIYDWSLLKDKYYSCILNDDKKVEVLCEHVSLNRQLGGNIFINPNMKVKYRSVTISFIIDQLKKEYKGYSKNIYRN